MQFVIVFPFLLKFECSYRTLVCFLAIDERRLKSLCDSQNAAYDQLKYTHIPYWDQDEQG
jgi:hypothetical protein